MRGLFVGTMFCTDWILFNINYTIITYWGGGLIEWLLPSPLYERFSRIHNFPSVHSYCLPDPVPRVHGVELS